MPGRGSLGYDYQPAESRDGLFGGNSNWRGPVWFPVNVLLLGALRAYERALAADTTFEYPVGSGRQRALQEIIEGLRGGLVDLFRVGLDGRRPGDPPHLPQGPLWGHPMFSEYFDGDTGAGLGAHTRRAGRPWWPT